MRIYIAATLTLRHEAQDLARILTAEGHTITSSWHTREDSTVEREVDMGGAERERIALRNFGDVNDSNALVLLLGEPATRHGSFIETGYALAAGKLVFVAPSSLDAAEVPLMLALCPVADSVSELVTMLRPRPLPARMASVAGYAEDDEPARGDEVLS